MSVLSSLFPAKLFTSALDLAHPNTSAGIY